MVSLADLVFAAKQAPGYDLDYSCVCDRYGSTGRWCCLLCTQFAQLRQRGLEASPRSLCPDKSVSSPGAIGVAAYYLAPRVDLQCHR